MAPIRSTLARIRPASAQIRPRPARIRPRFARIQPGFATGYSPNIGPQCRLGVSGLVPRCVETSQRSGPRRCGRRRGIGPAVVQPVAPSSPPRAFRPTASPAVAGEGVGGCGAAHWERRCCAVDSANGAADGHAKRDVPSVRLGFCSGCPVWEVDSGVAPGGPASAGVLPNFLQKLALKAQISTKVVLPEQEFDNSWATFRQLLRACGGPRDRQGQLSGTRGVASNSSVTFGRPTE